MYTSIKRKNDGFTIVETLIVLAIAGLIILIVLLAVPALQRNSRNTNIKSDASAVAGGINEYESNNAGVVPAFVSSAAGVVSIGKNSTDPNLTTAKVQGSTVVKVVSTAGKTSPAPDAITAPTPGDINIYEGETCAGLASTRAVAIVYSTETSSKTQTQCLDT